MTTFEQLLKEENLMDSPVGVFLSLRENIDDLEILKEICGHIDFNDSALFFKSVKEFLIDYGKRLSLMDGKEMAKQIGNKKISHIDAFRRAEESIILTINRPAFLIRNDRIDDSIVTKWKERIDEYEDKITKTIPSVGRIEIKGHHQHTWAGTGWLIKGTDIIVTNRHVAQIFASRYRKGCQIKTDALGSPFEVNIDFKEEYDIDEDREFLIKKVLHIAENDEPDIALLRIEQENEYGIPLPEGLEISSRMAHPHDNVFVLGYPAFDTNIKTKLYDFDLKKVSNVKRLAPGDIFPSSAAPYIYMHDCTTWYGNSGSPVVDLTTGKVVGIHYAGSHSEYRGLRANWAVRSTYLLDLLDELNIPHTY